MISSGAVVGEPLVSILIPAWGCERFIAPAIESALAQSYPRCEVVVVEDAGPDRTYEVAASIRDPRLTVVRNDRNLGQYRNKNAALDRASGELLKYLDGDDLLAPDAVETLVRAYQRAGEGISVVFGQFDVVNADGRPVGRPGGWGREGRIRGEDVLRRIVLDRLPGGRLGNVTPHLISRRCLEEVGRFPTDNPSPGDTETFLKLLALGDAVFVEEKVASYRVQPHSQTARNFGVRECDDFARVVRRAFDFWNERRRPSDAWWNERLRAEWQVWACSHNIFAALVARLRGRPDAFREIASMYERLGLTREFRSELVRGAAPYVARVLATKLRRRVGRADARPLFGSGPG